MQPANSGNPLFPLTIRFADGSEVVVDSVSDAECNLEWIDTEDATDPADPLRVTDRLGRPVHLKIEALRLVRCELADELDALPLSLREKAFQSGRESAWSRSDALEVIAWLSRAGLAVLGGEVWLPGELGPVIPTPFVYTWEIRQGEGEPWPDFAARANRGAMEYVSGFTWDPEDRVYQDRAPFFHLTVASP